MLLSKGFSSEQISQYNNAHVDFKSDCFGDLEILHLTVE